MNLAQANLIAMKWIEYLSPSCWRIEIAGSTRRGKPEVKDIELIAHPIPGSDMFGAEDYINNDLEKQLADMIELGASVIPIKNGIKYKQLYLPNEDINLDLFIVTPPAEWGVQFVIRTGPAEFSQWMVTQRYKGGALPSFANVKGGAVWIDDGHTKVEMPEEQNFFDFCGLAWIEPADRKPAW